MPRRVAVCGTYGGWNRHIKHDEEPCGPCIEAQQAYAAGWRSRNPDKTARYQARRRAAYRALIALRQQHAGDYYKLYQEELAKEQG